VNLSKGVGEFEFALVFVCVCVFQNLEAEVRDYFACFM